MLNNNKQISQQVYSETYAALQALGPDYIKGIPSEILEFIRLKSDTMYMPEIDQDKTISEQGFLEDTITMLAMLKYEFMCETPEEKAELLEYFQKNEREFEELLRSTKSLREVLKMVREDKE